MRNVLRGTDEVCHYWANQTQERGQAGNVMFAGTVLFSYATPIARLYPEKGLVLLNSARYSSSTSKHQSSAGGASVQFRRIQVPSIGIGGYSSRGYYDPMGREKEGKPNHKVNKDWFLAQARHKIVQASKAVHREGYLKQAQRLREDMEHYARVFKLNWELFEIPDESDLPEIKKKAKETAEEVARRAAVKEAKEERKKLERGAIPKWREGARIIVRQYLNGFDILRVVGDEVQTSQGASIPVEHAIKVWPLLCSLKASGKSFRANGHSIPLGVYRVDTFNEDAQGTLVAGCHTIKWEEISQIAAKLGLQEAA